MRSLFPEYSSPESPAMSKSAYLRKAQAIILQLAIGGGEVTPDHVHALLPCPQSVNPKTLGSAFFGLSRLGIIVPVRFVTSTRAVRHCGVYRTWRVADMALARRYLANYSKTGDTIANVRSITPALRN